MRRSRFSMWVLVTCAFIFYPPTVFGQSPEPAPASPSPSPAGGGAVLSQPQDVLAGFALLLTAAIVAMALVLLLTNILSRRYYETAIELARRGWRALPIVSPPFVEPAGGAAVGAAALKIDGPASIETSTTASYTLKEGDAAAASATWEVVAGTAALNQRADKPAVADVTAPAAGVITLKATKDGTSVTMQVAVTDAMAAHDIKVPFLGSGWASVTIAVLLLVLITGLSLTGRLGSEALATLFGGVLGYIFGKATTGSGSNAAPGG
jgi:hypothetical protein